MKKLMTKLEALLSAATFAEAGEVDAARQIIAEARIARSAAKRPPPADRNASPRQAQPGRRARQRPTR